jgi:hypothetical protein
MARMKFVLSLLLAVILLGCANSPQHRYAHLEVGMTRQQVVNLLGEPQRTRFNGALTVLEYNLNREQPAALHPEQPAQSAFYVIIGREDGRVRSFGRN